MASYFNTGTVGEIFVIDRGIYLQRRRLVPLYKAQLHNVQIKYSQLLHKLMVARLQYDSDWSQVGVYPAYYELADALNTVEPSLNFDGDKWSINCMLDCAMELLKEYGLLCKIGPNRY